MRIYCIAQETLLKALWWPKWEGNSKKRGIDICTYGRFIFLRSKYITLLCNYSPINFYKKVSLEKQMHFIFLKSRFCSFPCSVHDFCILFKNMLPTPRLPKFCPTLLQNSFIVTVLTHLTHSELCFACVQHKSPCSLKTK